MQQDSVATQIEQLQALFHQLEQQICDRSLLQPDADPVRKALAVFSTKLTQLSHWVTVAQPATELDDRAVAANQTEFICRFQPDGTLTFANSAYCRYYSQPAATLIGQSLCQLISVPAWTIVQQQWTRLSEANPIVAYPLEVVLPEGSVRWQRWTDRGIFDRQGKLIEIQGIGQDVTDYVRATRALVESEIKFHKLAEKLPGVIFRYVLHPDGREAVTYISSCCQEVYGVAAEAVMQNPRLIWATVYPTDLPLLQQTMRQSTPIGQLVQLEHRVITPAGRFKWVQVIASPEAQPNGDVIWDGVAIDISDRKQAAADLREGEARFRKLADNLPGVIFRYVWYPDGTELFTYLSPRCADLYEIEPSLILQDANLLWSIVHPDDLMALQDAYAVSALRLEVCSLEHRIITPSGCLKWLQIVARPECQPHQEIVWDGLAIDITKRKQAEAQIRASLQEKEALLQEIHHRVKNNLQIISSLLHLQVDRIADPQIRQSLADCWHRIDSMSLVHESLYRSRNLADVNFAQYIQSLAMNLFNIYNAHAYHVTFNANVDADIRFNLNQAIPCGLIINELITNALKHGLTNDRQPGEIFVTLARQSDHLIRLEVGNRGVTLPPDFAIDTCTSMGLKLVKKLVEQLEGSLVFDRGDATVFRIVFALADHSG